MSERLLSVDREGDGGPLLRFKEWDDCEPLDDETADAISAELDRLYAAAEANQAPGPDWKAKLREEVLGIPGCSSQAAAQAILHVLDLIDALPDPPNAARSRGNPPTPDPDAPPVYVPPEGHVAPVEGRNVPDGWVGRFTANSTAWFPAEHCRTNPNGWFEVRRVPAPEPATEWVPLTKLVGRTIKGCDRPVMGHGHDHDPSRWWPEADGIYLPFPDGALNLDTAQVLVLAEGER